MFAFYVNNVMSHISYPKVVILGSDRADAEVHWYMPAVCGAWWPRPFSMTLQEYTKRRAQCLKNASGTL